MKSTVTCKLQAGPSAVRCFLLFTEQMHTNDFSKTFCDGEEKETYSTAAIDNASLLCCIHGHLLVSFGCSDVLLIPEKQHTLFKI